MTRQFENEANADMHARTTAREIVEDFAGERLDYWVTGYGTGGTLNGVGRVLKAERPRHQDRPGRAVRRGPGRQRPAAGAQPRWLGLGRTPGVEAAPDAGLDARLYRQLVGDAVDAGDIDQLVTVTGPECMKASQDLARREGIFCGITSGGGFAAARIARKPAEAGTTILAMLTDTGERYLTTPLFADVPVEMTAEEEEIAKSTPMFAV